MEKLDDMEDRRYLFGSIHTLANRKETLMERELAEFGVTFKQWFLMSVVRNAFERPPSLNEAARVMGTSHQNIKKIASILERKGLVRMEKDKKDTRVTRLVLTEESDRFSAAIQGKAAVFTEALFDGLEAESLAQARLVVQRMTENLTRMEHKDTEE
jgi:DNA-binding MarR family transcriptional regulator